MAVLRKTVSLALLPLGLALLLTGCGRSVTSADPDNLEIYTQTVESKPGPPLEPVPQLQKFETFLYNDQGLRDPFSAPLDTSKSSGPRPDPNRPKQPLEAFPLDSLVMNGTLGAGGKIVGLVMSPDKVTHRVVPGNYLGQNDGKVIEVTPTKINITELVSDGAGGWIERPASISLPNQ
ncbi:MAG: pilus assembly protein PilP [Proteobacteria bacterium]|nr:pilus assembly protein PilP [Pseudomonadota bacterium]MBS0462203.1 pilus assembly protein PilP [Pseudomonadota bacterium]MBS0463644.1 pilus assembly protein PilP [Pseudomonadota bacterium]